MDVDDNNDLRYLYEYNNDAPRLCHRTNDGENEAPDQQLWRMDSMNRERKKRKEKAVGPDRKLVCADVARTRSVH